MWSGWVVTQEWAQQPRVFVPDKPFQSRVMLRFGLLDLFIINEENEVL
jgi:hypothetical protein